MSGQMTVTIWVDEQIDALSEDKIFLTDKVVGIDSLHAKLTKALNLQNLTLPNGDSPLAHALTADGFMFLPRQGNWRGILTLWRCGFVMRI